MKKQWPCWWQYLIPQHLLSRWMGKLADLRHKKLKNWAIKQFCQHYEVDLSKAEIQEIAQFKTFNEFFTRRLKPQFLPHNKDERAILSPVEGCVSQIGEIATGTLIQAKGKFFSLNDLLGGKTSVTDQFTGGHFLTAYLAPKNYHRIHMPCDGRLVCMRYVPGNLFSVNQESVTHIDSLFARNERVICIFESAFGPFALIAVGAMIVGSIVTVWHGVVDPCGGITDWSYQDHPIFLRQGEELGYFQLGSTVILLFPKNSVEWNSALNSESCLELGEEIARLH